MRAQIATALTFIALMICPASEHPDFGIFEIYEFPSPIGVVACKNFTNGKNQKTKTIYFVEKAQAGESMHSGRNRKSLTETDLLIHSETEYFYENDRLVLETRFRGPNHVLDRTTKYIYEEPHVVIAETYRADQTQEWRAVRRNGTSVLEVRYDDSGQRVIAITGNLSEASPDILAWGPPENQVSISAQMEKQSGSLTDMAVNIIIRNQASESQRLISGPTYYEEMSLELRDASGNLIPQDADYITACAKRFAELNPGRKAEWQTLWPGRAKVFASAYPLTYWYPKLSPGKYTLVVHRSLNGADYKLTSNPTRFEITD